MGNSTSTSKNSKITPHDKAILQLKLQRDKLNKSKQKLQLVINRETQIAKSCVKSNQLNKAKLALRKKKRQQSLLNNLERQSDTLEQLIDTIEFKLIEKDVLYGLEQGSKVLKEINNEMNIEKVEKIMDDTEEAIAYQNELSERLGSLLTNGEEQEVDEELEQLEIEMGVYKESANETKIDNADNVKQKLETLPDIPNDIIKSEKVQGKQEQEEQEEQEESRIPQLA